MHCTVSYVNAPPEDPACCLLQGIAYKGSPFSSWLTPFIIPIFSSLSLIFITDSILTTPFLEQKEGYTDLRGSNSPTKAMRYMLCVPLIIIQDVAVSTTMQPSLWDAVEGSLSERVDNSLPEDVSYLLGILVRIIIQ